MTAMTKPSRAARNRCVALLVTVLSLITAGCGGSDRSVTVTTLSASNVRYNGTMTVTVSGAGLTSPDLTMEVDGPCSSITRVPGAADFQTQFTCKVDGVGELIPKVRLPSGGVAASLRVMVPTPQVTIATRRDGTTSSIVVDLDPTAAPVSVKNFLAYASAGLYRNTIFHRVIKGRLIQGGGFTTGPTAVTGLGAPIALESNNGLKNLRGTIAMARTSVFDSATSQFYLNLIDNPEFDYVDVEHPGYAVFGTVSSGLDVIDGIGNVALNPAPPSGFPNLPAADVVITSVSQTR